MLRLVQRLFGEGSLTDAAEAGAPVFVVGYEVDVYRDWIVAAGTLTPGEWVVEGHVLAPPETLAALAASGRPLSLALDDGRHLDVFVVSEDGRVLNVEGATFTEPPAP